jgi:hypothetical protein
MMNRTIEGVLSEFRFLQNGFRVFADVLAAKNMATAAATDIQHNLL